MPILRATVRLTFPGGTTAGTNTWHVRTTDLPIGPAPSIMTVIHDFYDAMKSHFGAPYKWTWDGTLAQVDSDSPALITASSGWTVQGSSGGGSDSGPAGVGCVVTWRSSLATKSGRGRTFLAPLPAGWFEANGTLEETNLAALRQAAADLISGSISDGNGAVCVWSPTQSMGRDVIAATVNDRVAYLSSRRS